MGNLSKTTDIAALEQSEPFRSFSWQASLSRYLKYAPYSAGLGVVLVVIGLLLGSHPLSVGIGSLFYVLLPLLDMGGNPIVYFTSQGLSDGKKLVYPWEKVTRIERVPAKLWLIRKPQETLRVYITQDPLPPLTGIRGWLRDKGITREPRREYGCMVNSPDYIDRIVAVMEKYSGRDFH